MNRSSESSTARVTSSFEEARDESRFFFGAFVLTTFILAGGLWLVSTESGPDHSPRERIKYGFTHAAVACALFREDEGRWPRSWDEIAQRKYLDWWRPIDPWSDEEFVWFQWGDRAPIFISWGADQVPGGRGWDADIIGRDLHDR